MVPVQTPDQQPVMHALSVLDKELTDLHALFDAYELTDD